MIGSLGRVKKLLVLKMPKTSGYVKTSKLKDWDKDKNNKLMSFKKLCENTSYSSKTFMNFINFSGLII